MRITMNERKKDLWKKMSETYTEAVKASPSFRYGAWQEEYAQ